ncbi:hypothetical protein C5E08_02785 [Rathayibacter iranicus]|uniref:Uncharacterized protein n=2 Tax=Rathayibacter iranicus TaxID=59737 RepID=A0AAD1ACM7_9MICO|nr:hypothetical protein C7V51_02775 [Rathayibacter iranicus]PPI62546.1 hypothetical protein C5E08_02785 [Rathayibacter iranicus]PWJ61212.1 hypothetical protein B0H03_11949 [Rathayibacter iranicus NCPPB 2253 = VKM Ac-1602]
MKALARLCENAVANPPDVVLTDERVVPIENGFECRRRRSMSLRCGRCFSTGGWLVVMPPDQRVEVTHGFGYFGRGLASLACVVAAGLRWTDPMTTRPEGFDKQAF